MYAPELWENQQLSNLDGTVWLRKSFNISKDDSSKEALFELAKIDDHDITFLNGVENGTTNKYDQKRTYKIPPNILKEGANVIAIKIVDYQGGGGIWGDESDLKITLQNEIIPLAGKWNFYVIDIKYQTSPNSYPSLLYNAMVNPLIPFAIQGVLWYQGEANVTRADQYKKAYFCII